MKALQERQRVERESMQARHAQERAQPKKNDRE